jgi:hypothetical protein
MAGQQKSLATIRKSPAVITESREVLTDYRAAGNAAMGSVSSIP